MKEKSLLFFEEKIAAGPVAFVSGEFQYPLDLHELLIKHPSATFFVRVEGDSMQDAYIQSGDLLIVDRAINPQNGHIVVAILEGQFTVKRLRMKEQKIYLVPENEKYVPIDVTNREDFQIWGVVTYVVHRTC